MNYNEIPRFATAFAQWAAVLGGANCLGFRYKEKSKTIGIAAVFLLLQTLFLEGTKDVPLFLWAPCMAFSIFMMYLFLRLESGGRRITVVYCTSLAFLTAEFTASTAWLFNVYMMANQVGTVWLGIILFFLASGALTILLAKGEKVFLTEEYMHQMTARELCGILSLVLTVFILSNISFEVSAAGTVGQSLRHLIFLLRPIVDFCGLAVAYAYQSRISEYMAAKERDAMQMVLRSQYDQYRYYQNTMEMVHIKYHDLKHQITGLRAETDNEKRKEWLDRLEEELEENHLVDHTGNQVLDTILGAKVFQAQRIHARLTCVADGKLLGFMHVTDICTIFGNALDNALEAVAMIEDQEKRMIQVFLTRQKQFISIVVSNYCGEHGPKQSEQGTYLTTKSDKKNHGYGLKSIRYTVEKYEGSMTIRQPNDWFELHVLIPIPNA